MIPIILIYLLRFCGAEKSEFKYVVNMDSQVEYCDEESEAFIDFSGLTVGRYNETIAYMHGDVNFLKDLGPDTMAEIILQKESSGKYETIYTHEICDICAEMALGSESNYYKYTKYLNYGECPFVVDGDYSIDDFIVETDDLPLNSYTAGRYQALCNLYKNPEKDCTTTKEFLTCLTIKLLIELD